MKRVRASEFIKFELNGILEWEWGKKQQNKNNKNSSWIRDKHARFNKHQSLTDRNCNVSMDNATKWKTEKSTHTQKTQELRINLVNLSSFEIRNTHIYMLPTNNARKFLYKYKSSLMNPSVLIPFASLKIIISRIDITNMATHFQCSMLT